MKAIQIFEYGGPDVLELVEVPDPQPGEGEVRIAMRAASVNPIDWKVRSGAYAGRELPIGLGVDIAGVVDRVGEGVSAFAVGDEVLGSSSTPAYAELALASPAALVAKPPDLPWEVAGALGVGDLTAYRVLQQLHVKAGDLLLVHAAAGGVGVFAVQLAIACGAKVIGTASEANHELLRSFGATPVAYGEGLRERLLQIAPHGVDAVFDASGRGELALSVELAGGPQRVITIAASDAAKHGVTFSSGVSDTSGVDTSPALPEALQLIAEGRLKVPIWRTYPLAEAAAAHAESERGHLQGKIVLVAG